ncbi:MAG: imidazole glycerol phosphate synthase subunit HisF [Chitinophagaceae bacterium]|nr:imidazole glycerol phosphate synthase subunit HisF [Chitinophagaceae bacterium]
MGRVRIIPVLLLSKNGLYKTVKFQKAQYVGDPVNAVKIFNEKEADELVLLDYTASKEKRPIDHKKIAEIAGEAFMPMAYGGAIQTFEDAKRVFDGGFEKVVLNSVLFSNLLLVKEIADVYGAQAVVGSFDVKKNLFGAYKVYAGSGTKSTGKDPVEWAKELEQAGVGEIMVNAIDKDGTWEGYDEHLISKVANAVSVPVIACGGAGNTADFAKAVKAGASAVAAGSLFVYQKKGMGVLINFPTNFKLENTN